MAVAAAIKNPFVKPNALPGFGLTMGYTLVYLSLIVLIPLAVLVLKAASLGLDGIWAIAINPQVTAALRVTFGISFIAAIVNVVFGTIVAWVLTRYSFTGKRLIDAAVDLPFALPTAVAGLALSSLWAPNGWLGRLFVPDAVLSRAIGSINHAFNAIGQAFGENIVGGTFAWIAALFPPNGFKIAYSPLGIFIALVFIGLPFVVRTLQPVLSELDNEIEEASATLGATRFDTVTRVILPPLVPAMLTGFALAFARAIGEYGSVIFISDNLPYRSEIVPSLIIQKLEQNKYADATAIAVIMLAISFAILLAINLIQAWSRRRSGNA